ncbi:MAG TPA: hypothetical protein VIV65_07040, partial [Gemmatimonadaceae bacterium]
MRFTLVPARHLRADATAPVNSQPIHLEEAMADQNIKSNGQNPSDSVGDQSNQGTSGKSATSGSTGSSSQSGSSSS